MWFMYFWYVFGMFDFDVYVILGRLFSVCCVCLSVCVVCVNCMCECGVFVCVCDVCI